MAGLPVHRATTGAGRPPATLGGPGRARWKPPAWLGARAPCCPSLSACANKGGSAPTPRGSSAPTPPGHLRALGSVQAVQRGPPLRASDLAPPSPVSVALRVGEQTRVFSPVLHPVRHGEGAHGPLRNHTRCGDRQSRLLGNQPPPSAAAPVLGRPASQHAAVQDEVSVASLASAARPALSLLCGHRPAEPVLAGRSHAAPARGPAADWALRGGAVGPHRACDSGQWGERPLRGPGLKQAATRPPEAGAQEQGGLPGGRVSVGAGQCRTGRGPLGPAREYRNRLRLQGAMASSHTGHWSPVTG